MNFIDYTAAAAATNRVAAFRNHFTRLPLPSSFRLYGSSNYFCSTLYGHPIKMAAIMGHDQILNEVMMHIQANRGQVGLTEIIAQADLDHLILDTMRLRRPTTLKILLGLRSLNRNLGLKLPFREWLKYALETRNIAILHVILDINYTEGEEEVGLIEFFSLGDGGVVAKLVRKFPNVLYKHHTIKLTLTAPCYKASILELAILYGNEYIAEALLDAGADVNGVPHINPRADKRRKRPLHTAIEQGDISMVQLLLQRNAEIMTNKISCRQDTLLLAAQTGDRNLFALVQDKKRVGGSSRVYSFEEATRKWKS